jgi:outer membrane protein OmpA-like peptidoglycan-associated protein
MKINRHVILFGFLGVLCGACATVPKELISAREAYTRASYGPAAKQAPADLHKAKDALDKAERAFADDPRSSNARDLSYVAERRAEMAEIQASILSERSKAIQAEKSVQTVQSQIIRKTKEQLKDSLAQIPTPPEVKIEPRGTVITLSGSVLFPHNKAALMTSAKERLSEIASALLTTKDRTIVVEGHTDSTGSYSVNRDLSLRRAEAVRIHLISCGYPANKIEAHGLGKERPITSNATAEGRANNRRVEIIVVPESHN